MRLKQMLALLWPMLTLTGCRARYTPPEQPMPPNTILLSQMMRDLSAQPGFTEDLVKELEGGRHRSEPGKRGPALLTPDLIHELRKRILGKDWQGLDRFPGWTMREINPTVRVADKLVGNNPYLEGMSAVHPGSPAPTLDDQHTRTFIDLGPYTLTKALTVSLDKPSTFPPFTTEGLVTPLGMGVTRGDGPSALAPEHAESQRLADVLNRLSLNQLADVKPLIATLGGHAATTPQDLIAALLATGHTVTVTDSRYFANFGHLHYTPRGSDQQAMDVMMPFWVNTQIAIPHTGSLFHRPRPLLIPVSHAEYEWHIRAPKDRNGINADVSHYFGVDGKAEFRTMDTVDQAWVLKRDAHIYTGPDALEVTRLIALITLAYMHQHTARPTLPFGGYYTLGVCQDPVSAVEIKMTGRSTLFPNTVDSSLFNDPRDAEVNALFAAIPKDREGAKPQPERIFGSLPAVPGTGNAFAAITIPGLAPDLQASYTAWRSGDLHRTHRTVFYIAAASALGLFALCIAAGFAFHFRSLHTQR